MKTLYVQFDRELGDDREVCEVQKAVSVRRAKGLRAKLIAQLRLELDCNKELKGRYTILNSTYKAGWSVVAKFVIPDDMNLVPTLQKTYDDPKVAMAGLFTLVERKNGKFQYVKGVAYRD